MLSGLARFREYHTPNTFLDLFLTGTTMICFLLVTFKAQFRIGAVRIRIGSRGMFVYTP